MLPILARARGIAGALPQDAALQQRLRTVRIDRQGVVDVARRNIDYRAIQISGNSIYLPEGKNIGLGGIAKGYGVNRAVEVLVQAGFVDCLVDGGGDVKVSGTHDGEPWRLGIQDPRAEHA